eukprot:g31651.t1
MLEELYGKHRGCKEPPEMNEEDLEDLHAMLKEELPRTFAGVFGQKSKDSDMDGLDEDAAQRLRALQILQSTLGQTVGSSSPPTSPEMSPDISSPRSDHAIALHELRIHLPRLPPIRLLEAADSNEATRSFQKQGENDPFGSKDSQTSRHLEL